MSKKIIITHFAQEGSTLLNLFLTKNVEIILLHDQFSAPAYSKHDLIFGTFNIVPRTETITFIYRDFKNIDLTRLQLIGNKFTL